MPLGDEYIQGRATWGEFLAANPDAASKFSTPLHTFDITPQMREEIKQKGLPLYQVAAPIGAGAAAAAVQEPAEPEYRKGGKVKRKVKFLTNPDAMRLEMLSRGR